MFSSYRLSRIPQDDKLQAWNAADELFLKRHGDNQLGKVLIINEPFGALSVALSRLDVTVLNYSAMSLEAMAHNLAANECSPARLFDLKRNSELFDTVIVYPAKSVNYFSFLLEVASQALKPEGYVFVPTMVKHTSTGQISTMNKLFTDVTPGRAEKKARVIELRKPKHQTLSKTTEYKADTLGLSLKNLPGCYSANSLDQGARAFIEHYDRLTLNGPALDMGCGNGALSLALLQRNADLNITLVDENKQALESASINLATHFPTTEVSYFHSNGLNDVPELDFQLIVCNPPFHQETVLTEAISMKLFKDLSLQLSPGGECWIIGNRHLNYKNKLQKMFNHVNIEADTPKFQIYKCRN